jgi:hypothetical protein
MEITQAIQFANLACSNIDCEKAQGNYLNMS